MNKNGIFIMMVLGVVLMPILYLGSYMALVLPDGTGDPASGGSNYYRFGGEAAEKVFWPVEQIDRELRPSAWYHDNYRPLVVGVVHCLWKLDTCTRSSPLSPLPSPLSPLPSPLCQLTTDH